MSPSSIPTLVTAILSLILGLFVLGRNKKSSVNWTFAAWCFLTFYWQACWTLLFNVSDTEIARLLARLGYSGIIFIPIVFFHFVVAFTEDQKRRRLSFLFYSLGVAFLVLDWATDSFVVGVYKYGWGFYPRAGRFHILYLVFLVIMLVAGLHALVEFRRKLRGQPLKINQVNYILSSTVIYSLAGVDFLANYSVGYYPLGLLFTNVHAAIITYAIIQYRLLDISLVLKRSLIYGLILIGMLVPCYLIVIGGQGLAFRRNQLHLFVGNVVSPCCRWFCIS